MRFDCMAVEEAIWDHARDGKELSRDVLAHIERCESCAAAVADAQISVQALRCVRQYPAAPDCVTQVARRIRNPIRMPVFRRFAWIAVPAAIAVLLLVFLVPNKTPPVRQVKAPTPTKSQISIAKPVQPRQPARSRTPWYADYGRLIAKAMPAKTDRIAMALPEDQMHVTYEMPPLSRRSYFGGVISVAGQVNPLFIGDSIVFGQPRVNRVTEVTTNLYGCYNYFCAPVVPFDPVITTSSAFRNVAFDLDSARQEIGYFERNDNKSDNAALAYVWMSPTPLYTYHSSPTVTAQDTTSAVVENLSVGFSDSYSSTADKLKMAPAAKPASAGVRMTANLAKQAVIAGEPITLHITVTNESKTVVRLADSRPEADYRLEIHGPSGEVKPRPERWPVSVWRNLVRQVQPGETISCDYQVDRMYDLSAPGRYRISVKRFVLDKTNLTTGPLYLLVQPKPK